MLKRIVFDNVAGMFGQGGRATFMEEEAFSTCFDWSLVSLFSSSLPLHVSFNGQD